MSDELDKQARQVMRHYKIPFEEAKRMLKWQRIGSDE